MHVEHINGDDWMIHLDISMELKLSLVFQFRKQSKLPATKRNASSLKLYGYYLLRYLKLFFRKMGEDEQSSGCFDTEAIHEKEGKSIWF